MSIVPRLSLRIAMVSAIAAAASGAPASRPIAITEKAALTGPRLVIFWASWCIPCRAELKRVPALVRAAKPLPAAIVALDPPEVARRALDGKLPGIPVYADARPPALVLAEWGGAGAAMPLAVALDRNGEQCGIKRGLLGTDQLHAWARRCLR